MQLHRISAPLPCNPWTRFLRVVPPACSLFGTTSRYLCSRECKLPGAKRRTIVLNDAAQPGSTPGGLKPRQALLQVKGKPAVMTSHPCLLMTSSPPSLALTTNGITGDKPITKPLSVPHRSFTKVTSNTIHRLSSKAPVLLNSHPVCIRLAPAGSPEFPSG